MEEMLVESEKDGIFVKSETEMSKKLPIVDESKLINNPFSQDLIIKATRRIDAKAKVRGEDGIEVPASSLVDKAKSVKVYQSAAHRDLVLSLSAGGMRMLWYVLYEVKPGKDWIQMLPEQYLNRGGKGSKSSYLRAVEELVTNSFLSPTLQKHVYWINPIIMFAGNRIGKYSSRVIIENEATF